MYKIIFIILLVFSWYYYKKFRESENCYIELYSKYKQQVSEVRLIKHETNKKTKNKNKKSQTSTLNKIQNDNNKSINNKLYIITSSQYPIIDYRNPDYIQTFTNDKYIEEIPEHEFKNNNKNETSYLEKQQIQEKLSINNYKIEKNLQEHENNFVNKHEELYIENQNRQETLNQEEYEKKIDIQETPEENSKEETNSLHLKNDLDSKGSDLVEYESEYLNIPELSNLQSLLDEQILEDLFENMSKKKINTNKINLQVN